MKIFSRFLPRSVAPLKVATLGVAAWSIALGSCSQTPITVNLHALQASGNVSFVCRGDDNSPSGHQLNECPDQATSPTRRLIGLVTQTATNEIALIDLAAQSIVDVDPSTPGFSFLRVGARPGAIVTTPGGAASFVGVSGLDKNGIFALPTTCLGAPQKPQDSGRDLTSWSACHLSSAPGDITVVLDQVKVGDALRASCAGDAQSTSTELPQAQKDYHAECPADVSNEAGPVGRRKLLVALPEEHKLLLLDAQELLDRPAGQFEDCKGIDFPLAAAQPATPPSPSLPADLQLPAGTPTDACVATVYPHQDSPSQTPGGMANAGDTIYIADRTAPVVHRIDVSDPCALRERPPLLPYSYLSPDRMVTTSRIAVSPLTPTGKRYLYAVDDTDQPSASVMAFDVSPGSRQDTPLVFPGAPRQPYLPPDRLRFSAPVRDVNFVMRDFPAPDANGAGQFGLTCSPFEADNPPSPRASYRPNADFTLGANPSNLRGVFGFAMLTNGQIAVIDVEDFDAPCRRPKNANPFATPDFRGCASDLPGASTVASFYTLDGTENAAPTVTDESSCNVIEPHRPRASSLSISNTTVGLKAPTLRAFPQFSNPDPSSTVVSAQQPHMLAVNFPNPDPANATPIPAQVNVSSTPYTACEGANSQDCLIVNPNADNVRNSLTLPLVEPRSYALDESPSLTFEGKVFADRTSGFLSVASDDTATVNDPDANFCAAGVQDGEAIGAEADTLGIPSSDPAWRAAHADHVQITGDFPGVDDSYWTVGAGLACQQLLNDTLSAGSRDACAVKFGNLDNPAALDADRDLSISKAFSDHLEVTPRNCDGDCALKLQQLRCCFPSGTSYTVRSSQQWLLSAAAGLHDIAAAGSDRRCVHTASCDPRKKYFHSRAFEVCTEGTPGCQTGNPDLGCTIPPFSDTVSSPVNPGGPGSACIFENLTSRFIVYRGTQPSVPGMSFSWQTTGGFTPLTMTLTTQSSAVNPQSISYLAQLGMIAVIDGSTLGLTLFDLNSLAVSLPSPYF